MVKTLVSSVHTSDLLAIFSLIFRRKTPAKLFYLCQIFREFMVCGKCFATLQFFLLTALHPSHTPPHYTGLKLVNSQSRDPPIDKVI